MSDRLRFGPFEVDVRAGQLRKHGTTLRLRGQPMEVLLMLLERPGELVTRDELRERLWKGDTFVDFEHGLNAAVNKLRFALGDSREDPSYIETIPRRGYRFVGMLEPVPSAPRVPADPVEQPAAAPPRAQRLVGRLWLAAAAALALAAALAAFLAGDRSSPAATTQRTMVAVLPFENLSPDGEDDYFADGLTEEMVTMLGQLDPARVGVIARQSSAHYVAADGRAARMAQELGVHYIVQGSVRSDGHRVRVSARLVRAGDETHVWTDSYDRDVHDFLDVQNDVARAIAARVASEVAPGSPAFAVRLHRASPDAYEAYLRGRSLLGRRTVDSVAKGLEYLQEAIGRDPGFAAAHAGVAEAYALLASGRASAPAPTVAHAIESARRALQLNPKLAEGHATLAQIYCSYEYDWATAEREFQQAIALNPSSADTRIKFASCLSYMGRLDEALAEVMEARRLDPVSPLSNAQLAITLYRARRYDDANERLRALLELHPHYVVAYINLALVFAAEARYEDALAALDRAKELDADWLDPIALAGYVLGRAGRQDEALQILETLRGRAGKGFVEPYLVGLVHLGLGDLESAVDCMEASYRARSWMSALFKINPELDGLRGHPRFDALVARMQFPE